MRLHTDANAGRAARDQGAAAYAFGSDVVFGAGRYAPETAAGKRLLAHELAHVVQQSGGAPELGLGAAPYGIQRAVETLGGSWDTDSYSLAYDGGAHEGCEINRLRFTPNANVDASKIGLVQAVISRENGSVTSINRTVSTRSLPAGGADEGLHIDRKSARRNPVYGMDDPTTRNPTLGDSTPASNGEWGYRYRPFPTLMPSFEMRNDATLYDRPALPGHGANSSQVFETTALAVEGAQAGTFYGSVRWGWTSDAANVPSLVPLGLVSTGVPTASFRAASDLWNRNPTSTGASTLDLPIAAGTSGGRLPRDMTTTQIMERLRAIRAERESAVRGNLLSIIGLGERRTTETLDFEEAALRRELNSRMGDFPAPNLPAGTAYA